MSEFTKFKKHFKTEEKSTSGSKSSPKMQTTTLTTFTKSLVAKEYPTDSESSTFASSYINELQQWSKDINHTTVLIFDNADTVLVSSFRNRFIDLIALLVHNSKFRLHIIVVSQEKLFLVEKFDRWTVKELNQTASIELLSILAPDVPTNQLEKIAELLQGCPLALKVIGSMLNIYGQDITHELENELQQQPINVLDKVSDQKQRFSVIMDLILSKLEFIRKCGYMVSLFPGSFSREAGITILASKECLEMFEKQSLLDESFFAHQHHYKMHRLIKEYLKEKVNSSDKILFEKHFCKYYTKFLLNYAKESELNDIDEYVLSSEIKNIDLFKEMLLSGSQRNFSTEELATLAFLVSKGHVQTEELQSSFKLYLKILNHISEVLNPIVCGQLISHIVKHFYMRCKCNTIMEYMQNFFYSPCTDTFDCELITELFSMHSFLNLSQQEEEFLYNVGVHNCRHTLPLKVFILSFQYNAKYVVLIFTALVFLFFLTTIFCYLTPSPNQHKKEVMTISVVILIAAMMVIFYIVVKDLLYGNMLVEIEVGMKLLCYATTYPLLFFICYFFVNQFCSYLIKRNLPQSVLYYYDIIKYLSIFTGISYFLYCKKLHLCSSLPICC